MNEEKYLSKINQIKLKGIDKITQASNLTYDEFVENYLKLNIPCMFDESFTEEWHSVKSWADRDEKINWHTLEGLFGSSEVPVIKCEKLSQEYGSGGVIKMKFSEFAHHVKSTDKRDACYYLKDWHCAKQFPDYNFYDVPIYFQSDWLNEFWEDKDDDYKFVYIGPKGSWTPYHADVLRSFSWSANVCGIKRWVIYYPGCELNCTTNAKNETKFEVIQHQGEIIFIPSGWFHEVYNELDTISINHNWINAYNINRCWEFLKSRLGDVENEIKEFKEEPDFCSQCQMILRADSGMDFPDFFNFLHFISSKRMKLLHSEKQDSQPQPSDHTPCKHTTNEYASDLYSITQLISNMFEDDKFCCSINNDDKHTFVVDPKIYFELLCGFNNELVAK